MIANIICNVEQRVKVSIRNLRCVSVGSDSLYLQFKSIQSDL